MKDLTIGAVAAEAEVNVQTLRFYERRGLLDEPRRSAAGYRRYPAETVRVIRFIKRSQELGFTLDEIEELLSLRETRASCSTVRARALAKLETVDRKIDALQAMKRALEALVGSCERKPSERDCPILDALNADPKERR